MKYCAKCTGWLLFDLDQDTLTCKFCKTTAHFSEYSKIKHTKVECQKHLFHLPICYCTFIHKLYPNNQQGNKEANIEAKYQQIQDYFSFKAPPRQTLAQLLAEERANTETAYQLMQETIKINQQRFQKAIVEETTFGDHIHCLK